MAQQAETTHTVIAKQLIVYQRERSDVWQCRFKVDGKWQRASTKETELQAAKKRANELLIEAEIRKRSNLPVVTRKFRDVARLAIERMENELANNAGKVTYSAYIGYIKNYLIPVLGKKHVDRIDAAALDELEAWRIAETQKPISQSTKLTQNAALNRVFDEAELRGFLTASNRPKLDVKGRKSDRRPAFSLEEVRALLGNFDAWIARGRNALSVELRTLLHDYVTVLLDTGARPGVELMNLQWKQIKPTLSPIEVPTNTADEEGDPIVLTDLRKTVEISVSGKTGRRTMVGMKSTYTALLNIAKRNFPQDEWPMLNPLEQICSSNNAGYVFRLKDGTQPSSFTKLFDSYLDEHNLLIDPITGQRRVYYSLRHTYATLALTHDRVPIHTLAKQMGTSVLMIEKHYSHLKVVQAIDQLRREESRQLIAAGGVADEAYKSKAKR